MFILVIFLYVVFLITTGAQNGLGCHLQRFALLYSSLWSSGLSRCTWKVPERWTFRIPLTSVLSLKRKMAVPKSVVCKLCTKYRPPWELQISDWVLDKSHVLVQHAAPTSPMLKKIIKIICVGSWLRNHHVPFLTVVAWVCASSCLHAPSLTASFMVALSIKQRLGNASGTEKTSCSFLLLRTPEWNILGPHDIAEPSTGWWLLWAEGDQGAGNAVVLGRSNYIHYTSGEKQCWPGPFPGPQNLAS